MIEYSTDNEYTFKDYWCPGRGYEQSAYDTALTALKKYSTPIANKYERKFIETLKPSVEELYLKSGGDFVYEEPQVETYETIGGAPHLDGDYTVFGELVEGYDVLDNIASVSKSSSDRPLQNIRMKMRMLN
jgi:hypothetical protein